MWYRPINLDRLTSQHHTVFTLHSSSKESKVDHYVILEIFVTPYQMARFISTFDLGRMMCRISVVIIHMLAVVEVKWSHYRAVVAQRMGRGIALLFHDRGTRRGVSGQQHAPAALYPWERPGTHFTGGWVGLRASLDGRKISSPQEFDLGQSSP